MYNIDNLIIGNSAAGLNALQAFRRYNDHASLMIVSRECGEAYSRVLLPYYLNQKIGYDKLFLRNQDYYDRVKAQTRFNRTVVVLDFNHQTAELDDGETIGFGKALLALGSSPVKPPIKGMDNPGVFNLWTLEGALNIEKRLLPGSRIVIFGSGFISLMMAWVAFKRGLSVTIIELMSRIMPQVLDEEGSKILHQKIGAQGVDIKLGLSAEEIRQNNGCLDIVLPGEPSIKADLVVVATGVKANLDLVLDSPLTLDRGILVDEKMQSSLAGVYAAGDVAQGPTVYGEEKEIHPLWSTAVEHGKVAGANMAGRKIDYEGSLNMNVTQFFGTTIATMGRFCMEDDRVTEEIFSSESNYIKLVREQDNLLGIVVVGNPSMVRLPGYCRPHLKYNKKQRLTLDQLLHRLVAHELETETFRG